MTTTVNSKSGFYFFVTYTKAYDMRCRSPPPRMAWEVEKWYLNLGSYHQDHRRICRFTMFPQKWLVGKRLRDCWEESAQKPCRWSCSWALTIPVRSNHWKWQEWRSNAAVIHKCFAVMIHTWCYGNNQWLYYHFINSSPSSFKTSVSQPFFLAAHY